MVVDKPAGCTSHDVVARCRRAFRTKRVGHAGTLDPAVTGVLVVAVGRATRLVRYIGSHPKSYVGEVALGTSTSTLDAAGEETGRADMSGVTLDQVRAAAATLTGAIRQVPPMVSAVRVGGRRLHEMAREGIEVERAARPVTVHRFDVIEEVEPGVLRIEVDCSSGTFVRSLAADLGTALGGHAHLKSLRRTAVGPFVEAEAVPLADLEVRGAGVLLAAAEAVRGMQAVTLDESQTADIRHGRRLAAASVGAGQSSGPWAAFASTGDLVAVCRNDDGRFQPEVVLSG
ncbi:MAG TPA: tRNA pseudouridine(55) synthase TruB [Acidimicrobiales bacterium]|nr:tRNA pseudouridine(55) synthase TruB [Acidimicrobiales bacterium]